MRKVILLMHVSLDGFVAGPNGEWDWIFLTKRWRIMESMVGVIALHYQIEKIEA
jgi:hypothetical protein